MIVWPPNFLCLQKHMSHRITTKSTLSQVSNRHRRQYSHQNTSLLMLRWRLSRALTVQSPIFLNGCLRPANHGKA